jgi:hypothetical protein
LVFLIETLSKKEVLERIRCHLGFEGVFVVVPWAVVVVLHYYGRGMSIWKSLTSLETISMLWFKRKTLYLSGSLRGFMVNRMWRGGMKRRFFLNT